MMLRSGERPALVLHLLPIRGAAHDILSGADILLTATFVDQHSRMPSPHILNALFDLGPAEARLATRLATGLSLQQAATRCGIALHSARTYQVRIFRKTDTSQQSQLGALLKSARPFPTRIVAGRAKASAAVARNHIRRYCDRRRARQKRQPATCGTN